MSDRTIAVEAVDRRGADDDAAHLALLGYDTHFKREMHLYETFALGFTYLSPLVGVYSLFAFALDQAGPPAIWTFVIAGFGQLLVALVFGDIVSQFPIAGGIYPWARRLRGRRYAWMTGWIYAWALLITIAAVAYAAGPFSATLFGVAPTVNWTIGTALVLMGVAAIVNFSGTRNLSRVAFLGFMCELIGVVAVGLILMIFHSKHSPAVVFHSFGAASGSYIGGFLAAALIGMFQFYGFEACGDVAEEVSNAGRRIPRAMQLTILIGGSTAILLMLAFTMAIPNMHAVVTGQDANPIGTIFHTSLGSTGEKFFLAVAMVSFLSCVLSLQAASSRLIYSYGRDRMIPGSAVFGRFSDRLGIPPGAMTIAIVVPTIVVLISKISTDALTKIVSFAVVGIYLGFQMVVLASLIARLRGWRPAGRWTLGRWGLPVNVAALVYGVAAIVNMCWPRTPDVPWYDNYIVLLGTGIVVVVGLIYMLLARPYRHSAAPESDAIAIAERIRASRPDSLGAPITPGSRS